MSMAFFIIRRKPGLIQENWIDSGKLDELGIRVEHRKRKFDHFVWYQNR